MSTSYIISQVFTIAMYAFLAVSYVVKKRRSILIISTISIILNALAYVFLEAWTGLAVCGIVFARNIYSFWDYHKYGEQKKHSTRDIVVLIATILGLIAVAIPTYDGILSLMSVFGAALYNYSIWQKSPMAYKALGIPTCMLWIAYNAFVHSFFGVVLEGVLLIASTYGLVKALKAPKKHKRKK